MLKEITMFEFDEFANKHYLHNLYQTSNYALLKTEDNYDYEYLGYFENNNLVAATMILIKRIGLFNKYAYAPRGYILDYKNTDLLNKFSQEISEYLKRKNFVFLKIDPLIPINIYKAEDKSIIYKESDNLLESFKELGYKKLKDNLYFESQLPRFTAFIDLKDFSFNTMSKNTRNKVNNAMNKGLSLEKAGIDKLDIVYNFIKHQDKREFKYINNLYNIYNKNSLIDVFLVKIDYEELMKTAKDNYEKELLNNAKLSEMLKKNSTNHILNKKMLSDKKLVNYKNDIMEASKKYSENELSKYIGAAVIIKNNNKASILYSGINPSFRHINPNYFLHYKLMEYYKKEFEYLELNSITGDFSKDSPYYGLNEFKFGFNPYIYEYIGELDLIINEKIYNSLLLRGKLHKELDKN